MADSKRQSMVGKVATPNLKAGGVASKDVGDADSNLYKAVGSRIKITCAPNNNVLEGTLFTACNTTNAIAINTAPAPPNPSASLSSQPGDYHIIPFAHILSFEIIGLGERAREPAAGFDGAIPSIAKVDMAALMAREEQTIREMKKKDAQKGKGVSGDAQEIFDYLARTLPTRWANDQIVVNDAVLVQPPYTLDSVRAPAGKEQSVIQVKKILERHFQKKATATPRKGG
ncbi:anticodon-binding domain-containing protein [Boeremia exigua]|uniref:anticodon-binding domain-containing protein n=1 Tax=Boeremia exigua TaxID=749465 RepID=UPI001E8CE8E0|nr:anticodon-binding domain-containing protein [Boeremia exigua]KAH6644158.1 anticodon-binding domain-containing protein [Boeremia exigua]